MSASPHIDILERPFDWEDPGDDFDEIFGLPPLSPVVDVFDRDSFTDLLSEPQRLSQKGAAYPSIAAFSAALAQMPADKSGIVLGSGPNTKYWQEHGWQTLDVDAQCHPDFCADANDLVKAIDGSSRDFIFAECITFDDKTQQSVVLARLLEQSNKILPPQGVLLIKGGHVLRSVRDENDNVPDRHEAAELITKHGFKCVMVLGEWGEVDEEVLYYCVKEDDGYAASRAEGVRARVARSVLNNTRPEAPFIASKL